MAQKLLFRFSLLFQSWFGPVSFHQFILVNLLVQGIRNTCRERPGMFNNNKIVAGGGAGNLVFNNYFPAGSREFKCQEMLVKGIFQKYPFRIAFTDKFIQGRTGIIL